jgi:homoserine dehydrogenase
VQDALGYRLSRPVLVDVSDADVSPGVFLRALSLGADVVTANKKPIAGSLSDFEALYTTAEQHRRVLRAEATVGAGLPVLDTLQMLLATGDTLHRAEGCLSGTLGYLMGAMEQGEPLPSAPQLSWALPSPIPSPISPESMSLERRPFSPGLPRCHRCPFS